MEELNDFIYDALSSQKNLENDLILLIGDLNINSNNTKGFASDELTSISY